MMSEISGFLIPDLWRIVADYLNETDKIKLHAFGIKSDIKTQLIPYNEMSRDILRRMTQIVNFSASDHAFDLDIFTVFKENIGRSFRLATIDPFHQLKTSDTYIHVEFPGLQLSELIIISDTLEYLSVEAKSISKISYKTKTKTLEILKIFGLDCSSSVPELSGFGDIKQLFISSTKTKPESGQLVKRFTFSGHTKIREYYGDVNICRGDLPKMMPELEVYSLVDDVSDSPERTFSLFPKLQAFADDEFVYSRK